MMYGQMTAGSWIYIGSQGIVQGTYETFAEAGRQHYGGDLAGTLDPDGGPGRHGRRAAAGRDDGRRLASWRSSAEPRASRCGLRRATGYASPRTWMPLWRSSRTRARHGNRYRSGLLGNAAEVLPELVRRGVRPDLVTDQTPPTTLNGYLPAGWTLRQWRAAQQDPSAHAELAAAARRSIRSHVEAMLAFHRLGMPTFDYGNNIRASGAGRGGGERIRFPRLRAGVHPAAVLRGQGAVSLGGAVGQPGGHPADRSQGQGALSGRLTVASLAGSRRRADRVSGPAGAHLLARFGRAAPGRPCLQRHGRGGRTRRADRHWPRPP